MRALLCLFAFLCGCTSERDIGDEYIARLENILDVQAVDTLIIIPNFPSVRELKQSAPSNELSIREFLALRTCRLHTVIARRNSLIGKVAPPSQLLFNDLEILATGPRCVTKLDDTALATKLDQFLKKKRASINGSLWRAILGEQENRGFWRTHTGSSDYPSTLTIETTSNLISLREFVRLALSGDSEFSNADFTAIEKHLGQLRYGDGGQLLAEYARLTHTLDRANQLISARLKRALCLNGKATDKARYFQNVVRKYFIDGLQRHAVVLNQRESQLMPHYRSLENLLVESSPIPYRDWLTQREELIENGRLASRKHAQMIQKLYQQCGLTVGKPVG